MLGIAIGSSLVSSFVAGAFDKVTALVFRVDGGAWGKVPGMDDLVDGGAWGNADLFDGGACVIVVYLLTGAACGKDPWRVVEARVEGGGLS